MLLSTHILPEINAICNRVLIINQGRVVLDERPEHLGRTMGETFEVSLEVKGPRERILTELRSLQAVGRSERSRRAEQQACSYRCACCAGCVHQRRMLIAEATTEPPAPTETVKLLVTSADRSDIREALFFRLASAGYRS